ncbi:MAG: IclR family transcriptional regulator [Negativicutes bacterium]|nr:IclR family transcriptional regulator [Negativicutes bacterium]
MKPNSPYIIASVDRALELLSILGEHSSDMGVTELAKRMGVQKSTVHSLLQTLMGRGFVEQNCSGRYSLGIKLMHLGNICAERLDVRKAAKPVMTEIADETGEVVLLAMLSRGELIIVEKMEPQRPFLIIPKFDFTIAVHSTAVGKILLANASSEVVQEVISRGLRSYTPFTITTIEKLQEELAKVRAQGYAIGCNETIEGITCIAVPIYDAAGCVIAALSISSASSAVLADRYETLIQHLKDKAQYISKRLGYLGIRE